jgi:hypothetical protein
LLLEILQQKRRKRRNQKFFLDFAEVEETPNFYIKEKHVFFYKGSMCFFILSLTV